MKTPERITLEEIARLRDDWVQEFVDNTHDGSKTYRCLKCGAGILQKVAFVSIHALEFGEICSGWGQVERLPIPFCPQCEPEPATYGCLHLPMLRQMMPRELVLRIQ